VPGKNENAEDQQIGIPSRPTLMRGPTRSSGSSGRDRGLMDGGGVTANRASPLLRHLPKHWHRRLPQPRDVRPHRRELLPLPAVDVRHDLIRSHLDLVREPRAFGFVGALPPAAAQALQFLVAGEARDFVGARRGEVGIGERRRGIERRGDGDEQVSAAFVDRTLVVAALRQRSGLAGLPSPGWSGVRRGR
jgi:hypothetical protein